MWEQHSAFIATSYLVFFGLVACLIATILMRGKSSKRKLADLQARLKSAESNKAKTPDE